MKRKLIAILFSLFSLTATAQNTLVLQPGPEEGKDALLAGQTPTVNRGNSEEFISYYWTFSGNPAVGHSLMQFDVSEIPQNAEILSATLSLFHNPASGSDGHAGNNASYLRKVTTSWDESLVTWASKPPTTTFGQVVISESTAESQDYPDIDITHFVADWVSNPQMNYGFSIELINPTLYSSMKFASSDYSNAARRPKLVIEYSETDSCILIKPGPEIGKDAIVKQHLPSSNFGYAEEFISYYWTFSGTPGIGQSLIHFDLSSVPANAQIVSADLSLFYNPSSGSDGQAGDNACYLKRISSPWDENEVTWNSKPSTTGDGQVYLETSSAENQDYRNINIKHFVESWLNDPPSNYGLAIELINTNSLYNSMKFCSSDAEDADLRPELKICYSTTTSTIENGINKSTSPLVITPNPGKGLFKIRIAENSVLDKAELAIYNSMGIQIKSEILSNTFRISTQEIDLRGNPPGVYYLFLRHNDSIYIHKAVLN